MVTVIWSVGLISLLGVAAMVGARYRVQTTDSAISTDGAMAAAESAVNLAVMKILATPISLAFPLRCRMPGGERVWISVENEAGKIDLNTSTPAMLLRLFTALTRDQSAATVIVERIMAFRMPAAESGDRKPDVSKQVRFTTTLQLDQIDGVSPQLRRRAMPFVTVRSGRPEPDANVTSEALRDLLGLDRKSSAPNSSLPGNFTIRADVAGAHGARFIREALVSVGDVSQNALVIREWRRGDAMSTSSDRDAWTDDDNSPARACFDLGNQASL